MKKKVKEWLAIFEALGRIKPEEGELTPRQTSYRIGKMMRNIRPTVDQYQFEVREVQKKFGKPNERGEYLIDPKDVEAANEELKPSADREVEIDLGTPIFLSQLGKRDPGPVDFSILADCFEDK